MLPQSYPAGAQRVGVSADLTRAAQACVWSTLPTENTLSEQNPCKEPLAGLLGRNQRAAWTRNVHGAERGCEKQLRITQVECMEVLCCNHQDWPFTPPVPKGGSWDHLCQHPIHKDP